MNLCNINISCNTRKQLFSYSNDFIHIVTVNAEAIVISQHDNRLRNIINNAYSTIDGQIPLWLHKMKYSNISVEKISGSDLIYDVCEWAKISNKKIFLLGGDKESNTMAIHRLRQIYKIDVDGFSPNYEPYPFSYSNSKMIFSKLEEANPHVLFVGFGMRKQEYWIDDNRELLKSFGVEMAIGCGGTFDFVSGKIKRAPKYIQNVGLEGIWRFLKEPKMFRLRRLLISLKIFYYFCKYSKKQQYGC